MPRYEAWNVERAGEIIAGKALMEGAALPILHELQETFGCVPEAAVPLIAEALNLSRAEIHGSPSIMTSARSRRGGAC